MRLRRVGGATGGVVLTGLLGVSACGVDLLVGGEETGTTQAAESTGSSLASTGPSSAEDTLEPDPSTTSGPGPTTEPGTSSGNPGEGTTTGEGTTQAVEEGTTGEIECAGLGFADCSELTHCLWYGPAEGGECALSPCEDPAHECWKLGLRACDVAFACAWVGDPELGECAPIECVPCEILGLEQCNETPTCEWNELEMFCVS